MKLLEGVTRIRGINEEFIMGVKFVAMNKEYAKEMIDNW